MAKEITYTVRGHWPFPLDMLRHDQSRAAADADQALIDKMSAEFTEDDSYFADVEINLTSFSKPNTARWESFGWAVPGDAEHAFHKVAREKERHRRALASSALAKLTPEEREAIQWQGVR